MYNPNSLEEERLSWRSVVYYNIVRPIRRIFEVIDAYAELDDEDSTGTGIDVNIGTPESAGLASTSSHSLNPSISSDAERQLASLRLRLSPLLATESALAERLSGGTPGATASKGNVFVRSGWQLLGKAKGRDRTGAHFTGQRSSLENAPRRSHDSGNIVSENDRLIEEVAIILNACKDDIRELWELPTVRHLRDKRRLRLEEWAEL